MSKDRMLVLRIAGSVVGLLVVGVVVGVSLFFILSPFDPEKGSSWEGAFPAFFGFLGGVIVCTVGAALGATITQKLLRQRVPSGEPCWGHSLGWRSGRCAG